MEVYPSGLRRIDSISEQPRKLVPSSSTASDPPETLLVVDDDEIMRSLEARILSGKGYQVLQAASPAEALRLAGVTATIHLLLADFWMPEVDELELARSFRTMHPEAPVLLVSGSQSWTHDKIRDLDRFETLEKPFTANELLHGVSRLLHAAAHLQIRAR